MRRKAPSWRFYVLAAVLFVIVDIPWLLAQSKHVNRMIEAIQGSPLQVRTFLPQPHVLAPLA
jgi:uncharacterized membrane protein